MCVRLRGKWSTARQRGSGATRCAREEGGVAAVRRAMGREKTPRAETHRAARLTRIAEPRILHRHIDQGPIRSIEARRVEPGDSA